ncbi:DNA polymerase III subunit epsilon [Vibrio sp. 10N.286.49.B3]|uniref:3'-5' exonuclease n=1 Tax=Vibrio sp. 10N.286.49.B3 TaxID=1880855 RepID=UPI000C84BA7A|nr:3'-5' exonuclease [Vibrio sp. 10N.286.49.B3]PMH40335.1 DNA polymerase III subunit epsilon [Vibrio sp. 10N.286.49.B3]
MNRLFNYFHPLTRVTRERKKYLEQGNIPKLLATLIEKPSPDLADKAEDLDYLVLDLETTGLDSEHDLILSMGWVIVSNNRIDLATCQHLYINSDSQVNPETAVINHITPQMLVEGVSIHDGVLALLEAIEGRVLVAHGCMVETQFLNRYIRENYHVSDAPFLWLDTLCIEKKLAMAINNQEDLSLLLSATRERYNLPEYNSHNALVDAVSTAELLLAQQKRISPSEGVNFSHLYRLSN